MTRLTTCAKITRADAVIEGYTEHDATLTVGGQVYLPSSGYVPSSIERGSELQADSQALVGIISNANLSAVDLLAGVYDGARIDFLLVNWETETLVDTLLVAYLGNVKIGGPQYTVEIVSIEGELKKPLGRTVQIKCQAQLGDSNCGFALVAQSGTVATVPTSRRVFTDTGRTEADGFYNNGRVVWTSGPNAGRAMGVKQYTLATQTVELYEPMAFDISPADTYDIERGCDKTFATCRDDFNNAARFWLGFPYLPGNRNLVRGNV